MLSSVALAARLEAWPGAPRSPHLLLCRAEQGLYVGQGAAGGISAQIDHFGGAVEVEEADIAQFDVDRHIGRIACQA